MKKSLYSTTFLATAGLLALSAGDAFAQAAAPAAEKLKLSLGGFMTQYFGYADQKDSWETATGNQYKGFDVKSDSEVYFNGSLQLDNGLTVAVVQQLETQRSTGAGTENDFIDESYMRVFSPALGELKLGAMDPLTNALSVTAPFVGIRYNNADQNVWIIPSTTAANNSTTIGGGDDNRIGYYTPNFAGFRLGTSYTPSTTNDEDQPTVSETQLFDIGAQYGGKFGDFGFRVGANFWRSDAANDTASHDNYTFGADVTFADITVGGSYLIRDAHADPSATSATTSAELKTWDVGVVYRPGPFSVGLTYIRSTADGLISDGDDDKQSRWTLGATYSIGPGVQLVGNVLHHTYEDEADAATAENRGWAVVGGIQVDF